ncbi:MAG: hypothetical protein ACTSRC_17110 [Candidatus Helarchaeota archaeon]
MEDELSFHMFHMDWIIELDPGGGPKGGRVIAVGTPEEIASVATLKTGPFLIT